MSVSSNDVARFREDLMNIARTTLSSKILTQYRDHFANLAVDAVLRLKVIICMLDNYRISLFQLVQLLMVIILKVIK